MLPLAFSFQDANFIDAAYLSAVILFVIGVMRLNHPSTARQGNAIASVGMFIAITAVLLDKEVVEFTWVIVGAVVGTIIGVWSARSVKMTAMPQMVALFNGVGGGAAALIALAEYHHFFNDNTLFALDTEVPMLMSLVIGSISFAGSCIAFAKLQELMTGRPIQFPGQQIFNALLLIGIVATAVILANGETYELAILLGVLASILGIMVVLPIGGADMPVVISTLNAMTGLAAAATGFALHNNVLIIAGIVVGASGTILTNLMAKAMNRSIANVAFSGFGGGGHSGDGAAAGGPEGTVKSTTAADAAILMSYASSVIIVPGYGLAVAQAQHVVRELAEQLEEGGVEVKYAIHPVAGRMPGHMNVLLAEADVPYSQLVEMDDINPEFPRTDVVLVVGANDVTNPAAKNSPDSPIYGMPILEVDQAQNVIVLKRSMNPGFAGIENELYFNPKTQMLFGDAKQSLADLVTEVKNL